MRRIDKCGCALALLMAFGTTASALAAETGELMEHFLWATPAQSNAIALDPAKRGQIADELADVVVYALEFANMTGLDVAAAIDRKMAANALKYPVDKARGRSNKYDEL